MRACDNHIVQTLKITEHMLALADPGDAPGQDTGCGILCGVLRDSAYRLNKPAEAQKAAHVRKELCRTNNLARVCIQQALKTN